MLRTNAGSSFGQRLKCFEFKMLPAPLFVPTIPWPTNSLLRRKKKINKVIHYNKWYLMSIYFLVAVQFEILN